MPDLSMCEQYLDVPACKGLYPDLWIDQTCCLVLKPSDLDVTLQLWMPDSPILNRTASQIIWTLAESSKAVDIQRSGLASIEIAADELTLQKELWLGCSHSQFLFDMGRNGRARRVSLKIHSIRS